MKIEGVRFEKWLGCLPESYKDYERVARPLDCYPEYAGQPVGNMVNADCEAIGVENIFMYLHTDEGSYGMYGPILPALIPHIRGMVEFLKGQDAMAIELLWDRLYRMDRHSGSGYSMMAMSAIDCALWDLKGRTLGQPVYRLLGGENRPVNAYASTLGYSLERGQACEKALEIKAMGYQAQKWFFRYGPADGFAGMQKNLELAFALREACGAGYGLMFDAWRGWDLAYAKQMLRELEPMKPAWVEEPLMSRDIEGYCLLHASSAVPLAAGEHSYTRWEIKPFLERGCLDVIQADPTWTGGITELKKIGDLCELYGRALIPHGCTTPAGVHIAMASSPAVSPYMEFLIPYQHRQQLFQKTPLRPHNGMLRAHDLPGLALELDESKACQVEDLE